MVVSFQWRTSAGFASTGGRPPSRYPHRLMGASSLDGGEQSSCAAGPFLTRHRSTSLFVRIKKVVLGKDWLDFGCTFSNARVKSREVAISGKRLEAMFFLYFFSFITMYIFNI
jgi:hypothetical protein